VLQLAQDMANQLTCYVCSSKDLFTQSVSDSGQNLKTHVSGS